MNKYICVNFKRFDVPAALGGVNRQYGIHEFSRKIVEETQSGLGSYQGVEFAQYFPEAQLVGAVEAAKDVGILKIGSQGVFRKDIAVGGNFGAFTTNLPAAAVKALGCSSTIIGHCEERSDKNELLGLAGVTKRTLVNEVLNQEVVCAQKQGLEVLYCVGEKEDEVDDWQQVLAEQLEIGLRNCDLSKVVIAYEPVWSIGPGKTPADKPYITKVASFIKSVLEDQTPVIYGGGLKKENAGMLASIDQIDGGLIALTRFTGDFGFYCEEYLKIIDLYFRG